MQTLFYFILVPMVYMAFAILILGIAIKLIKLYRTPEHPATLQIYPEIKPRWMWALIDTFLFPTVRKHNLVHWVFLMMFHMAMLLLIIGHIELFREFRLFQIIPHEVFIGKGLVGLTLSISLLFFLFRRFVSPNRDISIPEDYFLLILLFLTVLFGSEMDWARRWYEYGEMTVEEYREYFISLLYFRPELPYGLTYSGHSFMMVLHVFFANLFLMLLPFSKIMHVFLSLPLNKLRRG